MNKEDLVLREVCLDDCKLLFRWANDSQVRKNSLSSEIISWETHQKWFNEKVKQPEHCQIFILETKNKTPIGQIRFNRDGTSVKISYSVDTIFRGQELGTILVEKGTEAILKTWQDITVIAGIIKPENIASKKVFERNNFILTSKDCCLEYRKVIKNTDKIER